MIQFKQHQFASFVTDLGGTTSHTAIVARSLNIPSIVALHHARQLIRENELLIVDGTQGVIIVDPDPQALAEYKLQPAPVGSRAAKLKRLRDIPRDHARRGRGRTAREYRAARRRRGRARKRRDRRRAVPHRVPVSEPRATCRTKTSNSRRTGAVVREWTACRSRSAPIDLGADKHIERRGSRRAPNPGARPARDPAVADRAADVPRATARDAARVALWQGENTDSDAGERAGNRSNARR